MGIKLIVEFMDHGPAALTASEWKAMVVVLEDANDVTRMTWSAVTDPKILRRIGLSAAAWTNMRGSLVRKRALEVAVPGKRGQVAKYRVPDFAPMGHQIDEESAKGHGIDEESGPMPHQIHEASAERVMGFMTPTPPTTPSQPPSPPEAPVEAQQPEGREGGGTASRQQDNPAFTTLARIAAKNPQLALGETELADLAPLVETWLQRTTAERMEQAITAGLPAAIGSPAGFIRGRLTKKLPPAIQAVPDQDRCGRTNCDPVTHMVTIPDGEQLPCAVCHPTGRAIARRQQGRAA